MRRGEKRGGIRERREVWSKRERGKGTGGNSVAGKNDRQETDEK